MRVMLLHNLNVSKGWVNGTRARLWPHFSWIGEPETLRRNTDEGPGKPKCIVRDRSNINLANEGTHPEFNVHRA